jgi:KDO2-lipid IV(A) lauroyltransferase
MANKFNCSVVFADIKHSKRGYYNVNIEVLVKDSKTLHYQELTRMHVQKLEQQIKDNPTRWLWSHKRWKHQQPANWQNQLQMLKSRFEEKFRRNA